MSLTFALQALLARHEAYMAEAEEGRRKMGDTINKLEEDKKELEASNAKTIEENRYLLDQLEQLNTNVSESDTHIRMLNALLESTRKDMDKKVALAAQTSQLEAQISAMEAEHARLQEELTSNGEESRTAVQRWKSAERTVNALSEQIDRIEKEASEERVRHAEVVARLERRRAVEKELEIAAGRLKGAAAAAAVGSQNGNCNVVSNFVKDILHDNANLQMGIIELREMLCGSNQEVENLREQMMLHKPVLSRTGDDGNPFLHAELTNTPRFEMSDIHVHHHYHAAPKVKEGETTSGFRRPKKKRYITTPGFQTPSTGCKTLRKRATPTSSAASILSQTLVTIPPPPQASPLHSHRWPLQSPNAASSTVLSSTPSSPQSTCPDHSVFDVADEIINSSRPTSPASTNIASPENRPLNTKQGSDVSLKIQAAQPAAISPPSIFGLLLDDNCDDGAAFPILDQSTILEEAEEDCSRPPTIEPNPDITSNQDCNPILQMRSRLHRASSAESIFSSRGMDIPRLHAPHTRLLSSPRPYVSMSNSHVEPITSSTSAVGKPSKYSLHGDPSSYNRLLLTSTSSTNPISTAHSTRSDKSSLGKRLGGWMTGKWGIAPTTSSRDLRAKASLAAINSKPSKVGEKQAATNNEAPNRSSSQVEAAKVDSALLEEALEAG